MKEHKKNLASESPKMSLINELLLDDVLRPQFWTYLNIGEDIIFPIFPDDQLFYGVLSMGVHLPIIKTIYISDLSSSQIKKFFVDLADLFKVKAEIFDEMDASYGQDLENRTANMSIV